MQISDAEWLVMHLIWEEGCSDAADVVDRLAQANDWTPATVKTMLHRLVRKGALHAEQSGKKYIYRAAVKKEACIRQASRSFFERVCGGDAVPALLHLVKMATITPAEAAEIRALLDEKSKHK